MAQYDNTNTLVLFPNERKEKDSQPDFTGEAHVQTPDGEVLRVRLAMWENETKSGTPYLKGKISAFDEQGGGRQQRQEQPKRQGILGRGRGRAPEPPQDDDIDDEIPF